MSRTLRRAWLPLLAGGTVLAADLASKEWALRALAPVGSGRRIPVIPGFMDFLLAYNTGGAFSIFHDRPWIITGGSAMITVFLLAWSIHWIVTRRNDVPSVRLAFGLILGGALGNLVDRVRFQYVVDFIHTYVRTGGREYAWPTFNIADSAIVAGIGLFLVLSLFTKKLDSEPASDADDLREDGAPETV